jgi:hypothetical protein
MHPRREIRALAGVLGALALAGCGGGSGGNTTAPSPVTPPAQATPTPTPAPTPPPAPNVSGFWTSQARQWNIELRQSGSRLTGVLRGFKNVTYDNLQDPVLQISGTISSSGHVDFSCAAYDFSSEGDANASGTRINGTTHDCANGCRNYGEIWVKQ